MVGLREPVTRWLILWLLAAERLGLCASNEPQPISATTGPSFLGDDGLWSPIEIRVGTPEQWVYVLPNTVSQETWVIGPGGCDDSSTCAQIRGNVFDSSQSTSFQPVGYYELDDNIVLPNSSQLYYGYYGFDTIALDDNNVVPHQIVATINTTDYLTGELGLGVAITRFNTSDNELTLISSLVENASLIPSHSYGYTAGASYRLTGVPASLTLGGVDTNRFTANNVSFSLSSGYVPAVQVSSVTVSAGTDTLPSNWNSNPRMLLNESNAAIFTIDTSTPYLWAPADVCESFANALNLTYNDTLQLYVFPSGNSPKSLRSLNLTFTFTLSKPDDASSNIQLKLPYDAFDLQLSYPFPQLGGQYGDPAVNYFPLRKATSKLGYVLGRAFLQETYLTVDYERFNFTLSQAVFTQEAVNHVALAAITRNPDGVFPGPETDSTGLSSGAKAGIGVGVAAAVLALLAIACLVYLRRRKAIPKEGTEKRQRCSQASRASRASRIVKPSSSKSTVVELLGDKRFPTEAPVHSSTSRFELADNTPVEMPAGDVSPAFFQQPTSSREHMTQRNDPQQPTELDPSGTYNFKRAEAEAAAAAAAAMGGSDRSGSPVPPYSPEEPPRRPGSSISPNSERHSHHFGGPPSSNGQGVSPISKRNSANVLAPISPVQGPWNQSQDDGQQQTSAAHGAWLNPQVQEQAPLRSFSRNSKFVEQGLSSQLSQHQAPEAASDSRSARFSWEE